MPQPGLRARAFRFLLRHFLSRQFPPDTPIPEQRARMERSTQQFLKTPPGISIQPVQAGSVPAEWVTDESSNPKRVILYFHGGGYTTGSALTHRDLTGRLARASQARVLALNYRLAPEHPYPAAVQDALAAYHWLLGQGVQSKQIVLAGDSAGGGLALALCLSLRENGEPQPAAVVALSPWVDLSMSGESVTTRAKLDPVVDVTQLGAHGKRYAGENDLRLPLISPLFADLHGLPPLLIHVGSHEVLFSDATQLAESARACGVDVTLYVGEGLWHVWHIYASFVPEAQAAIEEIGKYIRQGKMPA